MHPPIPLPPHTQTHAHPPGAPRGAVGTGEGVLCLRVGPRPGLGRRVVLGGARPCSRPFFVLLLLLLSLFFSGRVSAFARGPFRGFHVDKRQRPAPTQERAGHRAGFLGTEAKTTWSLKMSTHTTARGPRTRRSDTSGTTSLHAALKQHRPHGNRRLPRPGGTPPTRQPRRPDLMNRHCARKRATLTLSYIIVTLHQKRLLSPHINVYGCWCRSENDFKRETRSW